jgi:N-acetylmuramoyl-L-alanine amidase
MRKMRKRLVVWMTPHGWLKVGLSACLVLMMAFIFSYELPSTRTWTYWTLPLSGKTIAIDAGHGGPDGGAQSRNGLIEKDINLAVALYVRDYLQQAGAVVRMTRETDKDLADPGTKGYSRRKTEDLHERVDFVKQNKAEMLISIHLNSIPSPKWSGAQTFYYPGHADSSNLAGLIQSELRRNLQNTDRVAKQENKVFLLKEMTVPSALVEVGFLSHPEESGLMGQPVYQQKIAASIYQGILRYYAGEKTGM